MLKRYDDFILESLLTESVVYYSDKFRNIIKNIDSPVATALLDIESKDLDVDKNFIDVTDDKEQISFIPDKRAQRILDPSSKYVKMVLKNEFLVLQPEFMREMEHEDQPIPVFLTTDRSLKKFNPPEKNQGHIGYYVMTIDPISMGTELFGEVLLEKTLYHENGKITSEGSFSNSLGKFSKIKIFDFELRNGEKREGGIIVVLLRWAWNWMDLTDVSLEKVNKVLFNVKGRMG